LQSPYGAFCLRHVTRAAEHIAAAVGLQSPYGAFCLRLADIRQARM
jgi:hypothetical protein